VVDVLRLRTHGVGPRTVHSALAATPDPRSLSWQECRDVFDRAGGPYSYGLTQHLVAAGWDAHDVVLDLDLLRDAWIREHGPLPDAPDPRQALAMAVIEELRPRIVIDLNMKTFDAPQLADLRRRFPFIEHTIGVANVMKRLDRALGHDLVLTPSKPFATLLATTFRRRAEIYHHAFDPVRSAHATERDLRTIFTGKVGRGPYAERTRLIRALLRDELLDAWVAGDLSGGEQVIDARSEAPPLRELILGGLPLAVVGVLHRMTRRGGDLLGQRILDRLAAVERGSRAATVRSTETEAAFPSGRVNPPVYGDEMYRLVGRAAAVLHHEVNGAATSLRLFEVTGIGSALITNAVDGLEELFEVGQEVLTYRTEGEARGIVAWLNRDTAAATEIGQAGQRRTMRDHTVEARAQQLSSILREIDSRATARARAPRSDVAAFSRVAR